MHFKNIHVIRGIASFIVVVYHAKFVLWSGGSEYLKHFELKTPPDYLLFGIDMLSSCGFQCVIAFFILSAFTITHSIRKSKLPWKKFYHIRLVRIYAPFLVSVVFSVFVLTLVAGYLIPGICTVNREYTLRMCSAFQQQSLMTFLKTLVFIPDGEYAGFNFAYWSLLHEAVYYILCPMYVMLRNSKLIILMAGLAAAYYFTGLKIFYYQEFFIAGTLAYNFFSEGKIPVLRKRTFLPTAVILYVLVNLVVKASPVAADVIASLLCFAAFSYLLSGSHVSSFLKKLSESSYTLYLFHLPVHMLVYGILVKMTDTYVFYSRWPYYMSVVICLLACHYLYLLFEKRSLTYIASIKSSHHESH